jgi:hypothetical protein
VKRPKHPSKTADRRLAIAAMANRGHFVVREISAGVDPKRPLVALNSFER